MSEFATANRTALSRVKEVTWGETPANPAWKYMRFTGESLDDNIKTDTSKEIRSDRQTTDLVVVDAGAGGDINTEMSFDSFDDELVSVLMTDDWSAELAIVGVAGDISTVAVAAPAANVTSTTAGKFDDVVAGQWIRLSGFTNPALNDFFLVVSKIDGENLAVTPTPAAGETPALAAAHIDGSYIRNGVTEHSYAIQKQYLDATVATTRHVYNGMRVSTWNLDLKTGSIMTGKFGYKGKSGEFVTAAFAGETYVDAPETTIMNCVQNVQNLIQNGAAFGATGAVMSLSMTMDNQHREQKGIGVLGNVGIKAGTIALKGNMSQYFEDKTQADKFKNGGRFSVSFRLQDNDGNAYIITMPSCKYETFKENATGLNTDVMAQTTFMALKDPATECTIQIDKFAAL